MLLSPGWSERQERAFIEEHMPPTGVFLDIGAHAGYYTFVVAGRRPNSRIISIEPVHEYAAVLEFRHPRTGRHMRFATELPQDFKMLIESLGKAPPK